MTLDVEELFAPYVCVPHRHRTVDGGGVDVDGDLGRLRMHGIDDDGTGERREAAAHQREHCVTGDELEGRMCRVELPSSGEG